VPSTSLRPIFETRIEFIDQSRFFGTDYFLRMVGYVNDRTVTVIGDNYFINELVTQQMGAQVAGFFAVEHKVGGADMVKKLMDNAGSQGAALGLQVGVAPTEAQLSNLTDDIVWFVEQDVDGVKALVPQVFLSKKTVAALDEERRAGLGTIAAGENILIDADSVSNNDGTIRAKKSIVVESKGKVDNTSRAGLKNGGMRAGEDLVIDAKGDVNNIGWPRAVGRQLHR
jgi:filamentous hemagglutinin